ncbi:MAG: Mov34/MPN/PAD-1 family protein [Anaerolineae bacterium]|nr:Mov34/MPN/PAD-1 family protein [Anaerolineae bacterium]
MFTNLIGYQFATTTEWPLKTVVGYQYIVGRNGVFIHDANPFFEVVAPVATFTLHGDLPPITPGIRLKQPKLPGTVLEQIIADARQAKRHGLLIEAFYAVFRFGTRISVVKPRQDASLSHVTAPGGNESNLFMHVHTHGSGSAYFSAADDRDEQGLNLYCVLGNLNQPVPGSVLRAGVHGHFLPLKITDVFTATPLLKAMSDE